MSKTVDIIPEELAINGGKPYRSIPYPNKMIGAALIGDEELKELEDVVKEKSPFRHYGPGNPQKVKEFEEEAKKLLDVKYALAVSSGTAALFCAVAALGLGPGDEVIIPVFGWFSNYECVVAFGATPIFAEIDETLNLDPEDFERKITSKTKAVIAIHYQGGPARMDEICSVASKHGIKVIEDCAQSFGGSYKGKALGTIGDIGISSFQVNKILTCGDGGLVYTNNEEYFVRAVRYHDLGFVRPVFLEQLSNKLLASEEESFSGCQFRMNELSGAFMLAQIRKLPSILKICRKGHKQIIEAFKGCERFSFRPTDEGDCGITLSMKFGKAEEAEFFLKALAAEGVPVNPSSACCNLLKKYPVKSGRLPDGSILPASKNFTCYEKTGLGNASDAILERYISIGIGPLYEDRDIDDIIKSIEKVKKYLDMKER